MVIDHKKYDLFGKSLVQKLVIKPPFRFIFPITDHACFLYSLKGGIGYYVDGDRAILPARHSLFLNCIVSSKEINTVSPVENSEIVVVNFHPETLRSIYNNDLPSLLQPQRKLVSNQSIEEISNEFLIEKYIEGLLFYFDNPSLVNDEMLTLKLKEIILLLSQTQNAEKIQIIFSQLFSPVTYSFRQIIESNLFSQLTMTELARQQNLSVSSFKREFSKIYNDTPANYIKNRRLEKAQELLLVSGKRITDIAYECGFNDLAHFTKSFRERYNHSPSDFRSRHGKS